MADLVGGAFLSATIQVLFDRLASREVINFFHGKNHGDRILLLLRKLKLLLLGLSAVLNDAEDKQITNPAVKEWVEELKDVVYHADDLVDEIATEALRSKLEADFQSCISISIDLSQVLSINPLTLTTTTTASLFDAGIESRIEEIIDRLEYFAKEKDVLGLREVVGHNNLFHRSQTSSLVDESRVYGRDVGKEDIMKLLLPVDDEASGSSNEIDEMPMKMSRLKDLQTLTAFVVGNCSGSRINELKEFRHLRGRLSISRLQNIASCTDAMEAKLKEKNLLETLVLRWDSGITNDSQSERAVLDKLQPHTNLKHLEINRYRGTRFPEWLGDQSFCNMVSLRLKDCEHCVLLPSLGQLPSLKHLTISGMHSLRKVDPKFYGDCSLSKPFQSLETLIFSKMLDWEEWYILDDGEFSHLQELRVINCPRLIGGLPKHIPSCVRVEIRDCPGLTASLPMSCVADRLVLRGCDGVELGWQGLSSLVELVISSTSLNELTPELCTLTNLKDLRIEGCPDLLSFPDTRLPPMLTRLTIISCKAIRCLPERVMCLSNCLQRLEVKDCPKLVFPQFEELEKRYTSLEYLSLENCDSLSYLPLGLFPKLRTLNIKDVRNFSTLSTLNRLGFQNFASLEWLSLAGCSNMESFSQQVLIAPNLKTFQLWNCEKLKSLPDRMHSLTSLQSLSIYNCPGIESFSEGGLPSSLHEYEEDVLESFPEEGLLPSTLISLCIQSLPNLKSLNTKGLEHLGSLKNMRIAGCPKLQSLPEEGLPTSLLLLEISECLLLKPRCLRDQGQDWHKIARIPFLHTDSELSFDQRTVGPTQPYSLFSEFDTAIF
ncbi:hypothetical protein TEA_024268 [Camellia sinensis var. sinensis]|uniref:Uncharacterized protein n=1 Tax=Camellia sinensis var. sinensis TaxID=542762 RepID=A0A4V3WMJ2_CAMSN|nr:hypothetical protein TEA_024268 [Camellia sinensis var. sinensis]